jgi:hypothetical protein
MGDEYERGTGIGIQGKQQIGDLGTRGGIEVTGRLIGEKHGRSHHESSGNRDTLLLAPRQLARIVSDAGP